MSYGGGYGGASYRREEKEDLKRLNDRLCQYIQKVRTAADTGGINNQTFTDLFKLMEDDLNALRKMYEREMDGLRYIRNTELTTFFFSFFFFFFLTLLLHKYRCWLVLTASL